MQFNPLIGNDILLSNPYGSVYKIHGCVSKPEKIILTSEDYVNFSNKYELIRAQLLSLFIHHPIIFLGYSINDSNIKEILKTIFTYVELNSPQSQKIRNNFLLVEYVENSENEEVYEHDIELEGFETIRINRLPTDNYVSIYKALKELTLPVSVLDIRKVQNIVKDIYAGGKIKVSVATDIDRIENSEKILIIGNKDKIQYVSMQAKDFIDDYFNIVGEPNEDAIKLINRLRIQSSQYFPIFAFSSICESLTDAPKLKNQQVSKLQKFIDDEINNRLEFSSINEIINSDMAQWRKDKELTLAILYGKISSSEAKEYLTTYSNEKSSDYRRLLCAYDYKAYSKTQDLKLHP